MKQLSNFNRKTEEGKIHRGMSKVLIICFFFMVFGSSLEAQNKFGVQTGIDYNFKTSDIANYNFGVFYRIPLSTHWTVEPALNIFPTGTKTTKTETKRTSYYSSLHKITIINTVNKNTTTKVDAMSMDIPVIFAYRFSVSDRIDLQFGAGPVLIFLFSGTTTVDTKTKTHSSYGNSTNTKTNHEEFDTDGDLNYGGILRVGALINRFSINVDYTGYSSVTEKAFDSRSLMLRLGYHF